MINMATEEFCLRWNNFHTTVVSSFSGLRKEEEFVDVTIACDGKHLKAHKVVLSASSDFFRALLKDNPCQHPIIILRDANYFDLQAILAFIYQGEVNVSQDRLASLLRTAEALKIKGLADSESDNDLGKSDKEDRDDEATRKEATPEPRSPRPPDSPSLKRPRIDHNRSSAPSTRSGSVTNTTEVKNEPLEDDYPVVDLDPDMDQDDETNPDSKMHMNPPDISASLRFYEQEDRLPDADSFADHSGLASSSQSQNDHQTSGSGPNQDWPSYFFSGKNRSNVELLDLPLEQEHDSTYVETTFPFTCKICGKAMETKGRLMRHENVCARGIVGGTVPCEVCGKEFKSKNSYYNHKSIYHRVRDRGDFTVKRKD